MTIEEFDKIIKSIKTLQLKKDDHLSRMDKVDSNLCLFVCENVYNDTQEKLIDVLMSAVFGKLMEHVYWYLWDWKPGFSVEHDGIKYVIMNHDDYINATKIMYDM